MSHQRMLDGNIKPTQDDIKDTIGETWSLWFELRRYLEGNYHFVHHFVPELVYYGKKYGWTIRYRKSGKTLCSLFPENGAFTVLIVLGLKEIEKTYSTIDKLCPEVRSLFENTEQLRDGRWLWIRVLAKDDIESIKLLLNIKRKSKKLN